MKKALLILAITLFSYQANAQIEFGVSVGFPSADANTISNFAFSLDTNYYFPSESNFKYGLATGFMSFNIGTSSINIPVSNLSYIPLAASGKYWASDKVSMGLDLGYGVGVSGDWENESGFYFRPSVKYMLTGPLAVGLSYAGVAADGLMFANFTLGLSYSLN